MFQPLMLVACETTCYRDLDHAPATTIIIILIRNNSISWRFILREKRRSSCFLVVLGVSVVLCNFPTIIQISQRDLPHALSRHFPGDILHVQDRFLVARCLSCRLYIPKHLFMVETLMVAPWVDLAHLDTLPIKSSSLHVHVAMGDKQQRLFWPSSSIASPISANMCVLGRTRNSRLF